MNKLGILLLLLFWSNCFSQKLDTRALLDVDCRYRITIAPDEKIWATSQFGEIAVADSFNSNFRFHKMKLNSCIKNIFFLNSDVAIMYGSFGLDDEYIYRTTNNGKTFKKIELGAGEINCTYSDVNGLAWMGNSFGDIYFTKDAGKSWKVINNILHKDDCFNCIYMSDKNIGIAGSMSNSIYITNNNWTTSERINTPKDQGLIKNKGKFYSTKISSVISWENFYIISQDNKYFYSEKSKIEWKKLSTEIMNVIIDSKTNNLFGLTEAGNIVKFQNPDTYNLIFKSEQLNEYNEFQIRNGKFYLLTKDRTFLEIDKYKIRKTELYTTEYPIEKPYSLVKSNGNFYGIIRKHLYCTSELNGKWHRENVFDYNFGYDLELKNDSILVFWATNKKCEYNINTKVLSEIEIKNYLTDFLNFELKEVVINTRSAGCFHNDEVSIRKLLIRYKNAMDSIDFIEETKNRNIQTRIKTILDSINNNPLKLPKITDFNITHDDIKRALEKYKIRYPEADSISLELIDTLSEKTIKNIIDKFYGRSTERIEYIINIINTNNDTLSFYNWYSPEHEKSYMLPWGSKGLRCYSLDFSKLIGSLVCKTSYGYDAFDNITFLINVLRFIEEKKNE